jgi:hypothetical protein
MKIDCDDCVMKDIACGDCVVSFLTIPVRDATGDHPPVEMDRDQVNAVRALAGGGVVPPLRLVRGERAS